MNRPPDLTKSQLFLDDHWIDEQHKLTRLWHAADIYPNLSFAPRSRGKARPSGSLR